MSFPAAAQDDTALAIPTRQMGWVRVNHAKPAPIQEVLETQQIQAGMLTT